MEGTPGVGTPYPLDDFFEVGDLSRGGIEKTGYKTGYFGKI